MTGRHDPGIGHQQRRLQTQLPCQRAGPFGGVPAGDRPRTMLEIERDHREVNSIIR
jgi:hypothetical protein